MLKVENVNNVIVTRFDNVDRFNALITEQVKEELKKILSAPNTNLALNLKGVKFIDSSGFGVFLSVLKTAASNKGKFKLCCIGKEVLELFKLLQLHNVFEIHESEEACVASF
ncbi:MAG: STAS domain-containing protein [Bacteroidales bacterium]|nr:STAS domain-containing protein [Bacteroidales bacterium]MBN2818328.1 STAS domain-containing protein [Bacteroidales bacterium]